MASIAGAKMVAAAANAGALGNLPIWFVPMEAGRAMIRETRALTKKPFAINLRADLNQTELISMAIDEGAPLHQQGRAQHHQQRRRGHHLARLGARDRKSTRLNSSP